MSAIRLREGPTNREVRLDGDCAQIDGRRVEFARVERGGRLVAVRIDGREHAVVCAAAGNRIFVWCDGRAFTFERASGSRASAARETGGDLLSPMPGRVRRILVEADAEVKRGDVLLVLEAMKMEHAIRAPRDGRVRLCVAEGDRVEAGVELAQMSEEAPARRTNADAGSGG